MSARAKGRGGLLAPALPQVNLLPPEVRTARSVSRVKQWMAVAAVLAALVVGLAYVVGMFARNNAEAELADARATTVSLLAEQADYAAVPLTLNALDDAELARVLGTSAEVLWAPYFGAMESVVGPTMSIDTAVVALIDPVQEPEPLDSPAIATLTVVGRSTSVPDMPAWIEALDAVPGFVDTRIDVVALTGDQSLPYYEVTTRVRVTHAALANRFIDEGEG